MISSVPDDVGNTYNMRSTKADLLKCHFYCLSKMLSNSQIGLIIKSIKASTKADLESIANEIITNARHGAKNVRQFNLKNYQSAQIMTAVDTASFSVDSCGLFKANGFDLISYISLLPLLAATTSSEITPRFYFSAFVASLPMYDHVKYLLTSFGVPEQYLKVTILGVYSTTEVLAIRSLQGFSSKSIFDILSSSAAIAGIFYSNQVLVRLLRKYLFFIPVTIISSVLSYGSSKLVHHIGLYGVKSGISLLFETTANLILKKQTMNPPELPLEADDDVPDSMKCSICHDLMNDPVESLGFFCCEKCMSSWLHSNNQMIHPVTAEEISLDNVERNIAMNITTVKFRKLLVEEHQ